MALVESLSGIRGVYGTELTNEIAKKYANSFFELLKKKNPEKKSFKIVIGRDSRASGKNLLNSLIRGLDCDVIDVGINPAPVIENAVRAFNVEGGVIITASHNEPEFNGFKFLDKDGAIIRSLDCEYLIYKAHDTKNIIEFNNQKIIDKNKEAIIEYKKFIKNILKTEKIPVVLKVVVDPNGGSGIVAKEIFDDYGINAVYINMNFGEFKRLMEPKEESLKYLLEEITKEKADFAIGFDCDADRVEILQSNGSLVSGNQILALITEEILSDRHSENPNQNEHVVVNDATSYLVKEIVEKHDGKFIEVEVGEINVVDKMIELDSPIGGEGSCGGVIIPHSKCRDGILTFLVLLKLLKRKNKSLNELINEFPYYYYIKEKIKIKDDFWNLINKVEEYYQKKGFSLLKTGDKTGGLKCLKEDSWVWFRQSKTEDKVLRIISDSKDENIAKELIIEAKNLLESI